MSTDETSPSSAPTPAPTPSPKRAPSFGSVVDAYDRGRPGYPPEAARWLTGDQPLSVLELGAGTGKLTAALVALGHDVHATEPDPAMLDRLATTVHVSRLSQTSAEDIPAGDATYDVVIAGAAFEWFDKDKALPEIARVLKRGGHLALVAHVRDERIPWVKRLGRIVGHEELGVRDQTLEDSPYFGPLEAQSFKQWQVVDPHSLQDLVRSLPEVAGLSPEAREAKLGEVLALYDDYGRGMDGMQLPYVVECYRAVVGIRPQPKPSPAASDADADRTGVDPGAPVGEDTVAMADPPTDDDSGMLLIDFR